jgi:polysaccharide biosynthesis protein PslH
VKILFLTPRLPYPPLRGDKLHILHMIREMSERGHRITLLSFIGSEKERRFVEPLKQYCDKIFVVRLPAWRSLVNCGLALFSRVPFQVAFYRSRVMRETLASVLGEGAFDVVHVHLIRLAEYVRPVKGPARIIDATDAGSLYLQRFRDATRNPFKNVLLALELGRLRRYESTLADFEATTVCSEIDRQTLRERSPDARIELLHNSIDVKTLPDGDGTEPEAMRIICAGNMTYFPNIDSVLFFHREVFPLIKKRVPAAKVYIVGQNPPRKLQKLASEDFVITGFVPDIKQEYRKSAVAIAPIRFGAGTPFKVLEPMALGVAVVATPVSVKGLPVETGRDILIAESAEEFAGAVASVLQDTALRSRLGAQARSLVRGLYDSRVVAASLERIYESTKPVARAMLPQGQQVK